MSLVWSCVLGSVPIHRAVPVLLLESEPLIVLEVTFVTLPLTRGPGCLDLIFGTYSLPSPLLIVPAILRPGSPCCKLLDSRLACAHRLGLLAS